MKYCPNCGEKCSDNTKYCPSCGSPLNEKETYSSRPIIDAGNINTRSIPICIILSIVTFGIYLIYWQLKLNTEINYLSGEEKAASSGLVLFLTIITFGLYGIYWSYKMGERSDVISGRNRSYAILFTILQVVALPIISAVLMQDTINTTINNI